MLKHEIISPVSELPVYFNYYTVRNHLIPSHWHNPIEILFIVSGSMEIILNHKTYTLHEKDLFVINSGAIHLTMIHETSSILLLQIPIEIFEKSIKNMNQIHFQEYYPYTEFKENDNFLKMIAHLNDMLSIFQTKDAGYPFLFNSSLHQFLYQLYIHFSIKNDTLALHPKHLIHLERAINYINMHYKEAISLSEIASYLALNPEYFCRIFKKNMGFTFLEYLNQVRLTHIYEDLMKTDYSITHIQEQHGFTNYKVFNRMFKESYGCSPSEARKNKSHLF